MTSDPFERTTLVNDALTFATRCLGPHSARLMDDPAALARVLSRVRHDCSLEDAVLGVVFLEAKCTPVLADEFLAHFIDDLYRSGHRLIGPEMQRFLDTGDLVQSILGDIWADVSQLRFESRGPFLGFLLQRLRWKAANRHRSVSARREEPVEDDSESPDPSPATHAGDTEEFARMVLALTRMPDQDRELLRRHLRGENAREIGEALGLSHEAARKALQRARARAQRML